MTDKSCPERVRLVERLARAMNKKKRVDAEAAASGANKVAAEQELQSAVDAVRTKPADELCGGARGEREPS